MSLGVIREIQSIPPERRAECYLFQLTPLSRALAWHSPNNDRARSTHTHTHTHTHTQYKSLQS